MDKKRITPYIILSAALAGMLVCLCIFLRDAFLGCHDSLADLVYARIETPSQSYMRALRFCLARGRVGFIFPAVVTIRQLVNGHGSFTALWLLQHLPIMADVFLLSWIAGKKTKPVYGMFFGMCFMGFLQVNVWHSLIDCYPLDFMYGFALSVLSIYFFQEHLGKKGDKLFMVLSVFFFYESLQAYEPFLMACPVYGLLAFANARREKSGIKGFVKALIPHFVTSVVFVAIMVWLRRHPLVVEDVTPIDRYGTLTGFVKTWFTFSAGMFPLTHVRNVGFSSWFFSLDSMKGHPFFIVFAAVSMVTAVILMYREYAFLDAASRKKTDRTLLILSAAGLLYALFFPVSHALTENYQKWVTEGEAGGYVPTAISYFGWILFLSCFACLVVNRIAASGKKGLKYASVIFAGAAFFLGSHFTSVINEYFHDEHAPTGASVTAKAVAFYDMIEEISADGTRYDVIYVPGFIGINGDIELNEAFAESVLGYDIEVVNDPEEFAVYNADGACSVEFDYDEETREGTLVHAG